MKTNDERLIDAIEKAIAIGIERVAAQDLRCGRTDRAVAAARLAGVACFVKQLGRVPLCNDADRESHEDGTLFIEGIRRNEWIMKLGDPKGGDPAEWPEDLRVREFPKSAEGGAA